MWSVTLTAPSKPCSYQPCQLQPSELTSALCHEVQPKIVASSLGWQLDYTPLHQHSTQFSSVSVFMCGFQHVFVVLFHNVKISVSLCAGQRTQWDLNFFGVPWNALWIGEKSWCCHLTQLSCRRFSQAQLSLQHLSHASLNIHPPYHTTNRLIYFLSKFSFCFACSLFGSLLIEGVICPLHCGLAMKDHLILTS